MSFSAYLFDYNGVLVDDEHVHWAAFRDVLRPMGIEMTQADYWEKYLGFDDLGAFRAVLADHGRAVTDEHLHELVELKKPTYLALAKDQLKGFEGAGALLRRLAMGGAPIGIVSGALRNEIELGLEVLDAKAAVRFIVSAEDTRASKPDPEGYVIGKQRLQQLSGQQLVGQQLVGQQLVGQQLVGQQLVGRQLVGQQPGGSDCAGADLAARTLVIEDSIAGIEAAIGAGLSCLAVAHSYDAAQLRAAGAVDVVARIAEVSDEYLEELANKAGL